MLQDTESIPCFKNGTIVARCSFVSARVLVVDDDPNIRSLIAVTLKRAGFRTESAQDGTAAMAWLRSSAFDLVVLDLMMPRMSGWELLDLLKVESTEELPRVIIVTAAPSRELDNMGDPVSAVLTKPFDVQQLVQTARACLA